MKARFETDETTSINVRSEQQTARINVRSTSGAVYSVNGQKGDIVLTALDVGALPDSTTIPSKTSDLTNDSDYITNSALSGYATETYVDTGLASKQPTLVSGTNIKTINNESLLGSGNINIESGAVDSVNGQTGDVVLTASDVGALPSSTTIPTKTSDITNDSGYITGITSSDVTSALGYTPYNSSNPAGYTSNVGTVTSVNNTQPDVNGNVTLNIPQPTIDNAISTTSTNAVQNKAIPSYIVSRGQNLVSNGFSTLGNNYNFSTMTYTGADTYGAGGCFYYTSDSSGRVRSDEYMPIDITQSYKLSYAVKNTTLTSTYDFIDMYDIDFNRIAAGNCGFTAGTTTTLAQDLNNGDTVIYFTDLSNWNTESTSQYLRALIFWKYKNSYGYEYPTEYYSRYWWYNLWADSSVAIDKVNNTITLSSGWTHGSFSAGHPVSQGTLSGANVYGNSGYKPTPNEWTVKTYTFDSSKYRNGTAYIQLGWLANYSNQTDNTFSVSSISFTSNVDLKQFIDTCGDIETALNTIRGV